MSNNDDNVNTVDTPVNTVNIDNLDTLRDFVYEKKEIIPEIQTNNNSITNHINYESDINDESDNSDFVDDESVIGDTQSIKSNSNTVIVEKYYSDINNKMQKVRVQIPSYREKTMPKREYDKLNSDNNEVKNIFLLPKSYKKEYKFM